MCGILFGISPATIGQSHTDLISKRGPDSTNTHKLTVAGKTLTFTSSILALRGPVPVPQPLIHRDGSVLCWNGEAWRIDGQALPAGVNDTERVFEVFASGGARDAVKRIEGEYAFLFYDANKAVVAYGRDWAGRRSLMRFSSELDGGVVIASVGDGEKGWEEVEAGGGFWEMEIGSRRREWVIAHEIKGPSAGITDMPLTGSSPEVAALQEVLTNAVHLRVQGIPAPPISATESLGTPVKLAILFSGGVDCTTLACLAHSTMPLGEPIDLLNVAFENPRLVSNHPTNTKITDPYSLCPDRQTGLSSYQRLLSACPGRQFRFVHCNIAYSQVLKHKGTVVGLMSPHNTEMDLSIALAFYFASRGSGLLDGKPYTTPARILLSGLGADELFGGYVRHKKAFLRGGYQALNEELELDFLRLPQRNLGRDDRVVSHWAKEVRYPFLDREVVDFAICTPVTKKCPFGLQDEGCGNGMERAKMVLRLVAQNLGLGGVAGEPKRAVQFGARTAKMTGAGRKMRGTDAIE